jgi:YVTN family beta-propeller protein
MRWWLVVAMLVVSAGRSGAAPFAWLAHQSTNQVARVDLATHTTISVVVAASPISTAASLDGRRAYTHSTDSTVTVIDATVPSVIATIPVASFPSAIVTRPDAAKAYVALGDGTVAVIDGTSNTIVDSIPVGSAPGYGAFVVNQAGTYAYLMKSEYPVTSIAVIDMVTDTMVADILLNTNNTFPLGVAVSPDGTRVYATVFNEMQVYVVDTTANLLDGVIPLSMDYGQAIPNGLAVSPDGSRVYVVEEVTDRLAVLDAAAMTEIESIPVGSSPTVVDLTPDGSRAYVLNTGGSSFTVVDTSDNSVIGTVLTVDDYPGAGERFIAPGTTTTTSTTTSTLGTTSSSTLGATSSTTSSSSTSSTTSTTIAPPPVLSATGLVCQKTIALSFKRYGAKAHGAFVSCFQRLLLAVATGGDTGDAAADCVADLDPTLPFSKVTKLRNVARNQILMRCASVTPAMLGFPCDPGAATMDETADCVLDAQILRVTQALAAEYGASCGVATAAGLATRYPGLCTAP